MSTRTWIVYPAGASSGSGVSSLNGQTGALTLDAGTGITITPGAGTLTISATGASSPYYVNEFTLSPTDISNGYVTLSQAPDTAADTILTVIGGPMQNYGPDYTVSGSQLSWSGLFLSTVLVSGDILVVQFN